MVGTWVRWAGRDLRQRWVLVSSIALVIALGTGTYAALAGTSEWRRLSNDLSYEAVAMHDVRVVLSPGTFARQGELAATARDIPDPSVVKLARERLVQPTQLSVRSDAGPVVVPATVIGHSALTGSTVDAVHLAAGALPGPGAAVLEEKFARYHGLPARGSLSLPGRAQLRYTGLGVGPEEFYVVSRDGGSLTLGAGAVATLYTDLPTAQALAPGLSGRVNDLVLRLRAGADRGRTVQDLRSAFDRHVPPLAVEVLTRDDDPAYRILHEDVGGDEKVWTVISLLVLLGAMLAAANLTTRMVEAQRREIGIGMAMGMGRAALAVRPMLLGAQIAVAGTGLGVAVALAMEQPLADLYRTSLPLPVWQTPFQVGPFLRAAAAGIALPLVAIVVPVWRAVRVEPVQAIRVGHLAARRSRLLGVVRWVRVPGRGYRAMPLRNVARTPRRTVLTSLAVAAAITTLVAVGGLLESFRTTLHDGQADLARGASDRLMVTLDTWYAVEDPVVASIAGLPEVRRAVPGLRVPMRARTSGSTVDLVAEVLHPDSPWRPALVEGTSSGGVVLARKAAADLGVGTGERVTLRFAVPGPSGGARTTTQEVTVAGLHANPLRSLTYLDQREGERLGLSGVVNRLTLLPAAGVTQPALRSELFAYPAVATIEDVGSTAKLFDDLLRQFLGVLLVMSAAVLLLAVLIAYNSSVIAVDERGREHATMLAFGLPVGTLLGMLVVESLLTGLLGTLTGLGGGWVVLRWMVGSLLSETLPELAIPAVLGTSTVAVAVAVGIGAVAVAPLLTVRRLRRLDVASTLRVME